MAHRVFVDGAAGTTGLEIHERLAGRSEFEVLVLDEAQRKDLEARREALNDADFAVLCLPDEAAREAVALLDPSSRTRLIDASSAHRTAQGWTYGFPEIIGREAIAGARLVSNPGCYPTGFLALVVPLVRARILPPDYPLSLNAVSGFSGGGKPLIERFAKDREIAFRAYALDLGHKHLAEMQTHAGLTHPPLFAPSVVDVHRGMVVEVPLALHHLPGRPRLADLRDELAQFYAASPIVQVSPETPGEILLRRNARAWDGMELFVTGSDELGQARLIARLDNLGKGASGAAVQSLNLMAGLPQTEGLALG